MNATGARWDAHNNLVGHEDLRFATFSEAARQAGPECPGCKVNIRFEVAREDDSDPRGPYYLGRGRCDTQGCYWPNIIDDQ